MALPSAIILPPDTRANQPAAASVAAGTLYCVSDEGNILEQSDGAAWVAYSPVGSGSGDVTAVGTLTADMVILGDGTTNVKALAAGTAGQVLTMNGGATAAEWAAAAASGGIGLSVLGTFTPPVDGDFAWVNQNSAATTVVGDGIVLSGAAAGAGDDEWALRVKSAPATPYTITAYIIPSPFRQNFRFDGLIFRASGDGKFAAFGNFWNTFSGNPRRVSVYNFSSPTAVNDDVNNVDWSFQETPYWLQISDDGTDRYYRLSTNGVDWYQFYTEGNTTYFTADQVGFGINRRSAGTAILTLLSWEET